MNREDIEANVKRIFSELFNKQISESECTTYILCGVNDLKARDLVYFMVEIEKYFSVNFTEENIENKDLFTLNGIINSIERLLADKST